MEVSGDVPHSVASDRISPGRARRWRNRAACVLVPALLGQWLWVADAAAEVDVLEELDCLALTIYFEARGEPKIGQLAVGHVVMNRAAHPLFPAAVCDVVRQGGTDGGKLARGCQFTWWCDDVSNAPINVSAWKRSRALARRIYWNYSKDPTAGALWYHADYVAPYWRRRFAQGPKIGRHIFYWLGSKTALDVTPGDADGRSSLLRQ